MSILKIALMGHPILKQEAARVADPTAPEIKRVVQDMVETLIDADAAGLAAPQVHLPLRIVVFQAPPDRAEGDIDEDEAHDHTAPFTVLINPEIEVLSDSQSAGWEGCLSVPGLRGRVTRPDHILYRGVDQNGQPIERVARGFHARVVQHECDHLDGILYPQRMDDMGQFLFESEIRHWIDPPSAQEDTDG